jgi:hypothetical protein
LAMQRRNAHFHYLEPLILLVAIMAGATLVQADRGEIIQETQHPHQTQGGESESQGY